MTTVPEARYCSRAIEHHIRKNRTFAYQIINIEPLVVGFYFRKKSQIMFKCKKCLRLRKLRKMTQLWHCDSCIKGRQRSLPEDIKSRIDLVKQTNPVCINDIIDDDNNIDTSIYDFTEIFKNGKPVSYRCFKY